ncbi:hypothetical protein MPTK1_3g24410 [Marchantia polymorpha subsp. ruderalis]|uniref:Uncharacterized protein n=1 Tax=Marchantia polymorpha subsp. ruderalis TaxID=1480154 RepID=A0AAF6B4C0_MARPO|nr:hypothetical protein Mp_3g24410 [Marchantia polymorpha subsp. ruderalis]
MDWLKDGWATPWMISRKWPEAITGEELQQRLELVEEAAKQPCGSGKSHITSYLQHLALALCTAAKWEHDHKLVDKEASHFFSILYSADLSEHLEAYLQHPEGPDETELNDLALHCSAFLIDECKLVLRSLAETAKVEPRKVTHGVHLLRSLCVAIDSKTPFNEQIADTPLPVWLPSHPFRRFTNAASSATAAAATQVEEHHHGKRSSRSVIEHQHSLILLEQELGKGSKPKEYLRIKLLLEYFGNGYSLPGFQLLVSLLYASVSQKLSLELGEVVLRFVSVAIPFLKDHKRTTFLAPCLDMQRHVVSCYMSQKLDKISLATVTMIMNHLRIIFRLLLPAETAEYLIIDMQKRQRDQFIQFLYPNSAPEKASSRHLFS